ncbi:hypothetical protein NFI96_019014 [Prochilodus magdalenae]|nr:hypothetical protein NFI96_019014 [Prochilodus magdalenae]
MICSHIATAPEEELRKSGEAKYHHLNEDLHVLIEVFAPPAEAYARMGHALEEIKKFLIPDYNDEIRQAQLQELTFLNGGSEDAKVPAVRGKPNSRARGTPAPGSHRTRGGVPPPQAVVPRGVAPRGAPPSRVPSSRGRGVPAQRARGAPPPGGYRPPPPVVQDSYGEYCPMGSVLWAVSYGQCPVGSVLRAVSCGQCPMGSVLRAVSYGQCPVGRVLWAVSYGQRPVGSVL